MLIGLVATTVLSIRFGVRKEAFNYLILKLKTAIILKNFGCAYFMVDNDDTLR